MEPKHNILHFFSCIFFLIFLLNFVLAFTSVQAHPTHNQDTKTPRTLDYLKNLVGTRKGHSAKGLSHLKKYLSNLGYMNFDDKVTKPPLENDDLFDENLELAIRAYQSFFKLDVTGVLDAKTVAQIAQPRCGVPDNFSVLNKTQLRSGKMPIIASHYTFFPGKPTWPAAKRNLTYSFQKYDTSLDEGISDATNLWRIVSPFTFRYIPDYDKADVKISFQYRDHGDGNPFDGPGGVLAHAFGPPDGRLHFDGDEKYVVGVVPGAFDLQTVGLHELGHVLGLGHSSDGNAIMWPYIGNGFRKGMDKDDIAGIKNLYPS